MLDNHTAAHQVTGRGERLVKLACLFLHLKTKGSTWLRGWGITFWVVSSSAEPCWRHKIKIVKQQLSCQDVLPHGNGARTGRSCARYTYVVGWCRRLFLRLSLCGSTSSVGVDMFWYNLWKMCTLNPIHSVVIFVEDTTLKNKITNIFFFSASTWLGLLKLTHK